MEDLDEKLEAEVKKVAESEDSEEVAESEDSEEVAANVSVEDE